MDQAFNALRNNLIPLSGGMLEGLTTDAISVLLAERLEASHVVNISNVDAVYSADPKVDPKAKRFTEMTHAELVDLAAKGDSRKARTNFVFDLVATKIAARSNIEIHFVAGKNLDGVKAAILRQKHAGTVVRD
jgi:uridylate kinase